MNVSHKYLLNHSFQVKFILLIANCIFIFGINLQHYFLPRIVSILQKVTLLINLNFNPKGYAFR
jgi:hypothetical protein